MDNKKRDLENKIFEFVPESLAEPFSFQTRTPASIAAVAITAIITTIEKMIHSFRDVAVSFPPPLSVPIDL